jgi:hypothetical protein
MKRQGSRLDDRPCPLRGCMSPEIPPNHQSLAVTVTPLHCCNAAASAGASATPGQSICLLERITNSSNKVTQHTPSVSLSVIGY